MLIVLPLLQLSDIAANYAVRHLVLHHFQKMEISTTILCLHSAISAPILRSPLELSGADSALLEMDSEYYGCCILFTFVVKMFRTIQLIFFDRNYRINAVQKILEQLIDSRLIRYPNPVNPVNPV